MHVKHVLDDTRYFWRNNIPNIRGAGGRGIVFCLGRAAFELKLWQQVLLSCGPQQQAF
jgi:hypothetical protein